MYGLMSAPGSVGRTESQVPVTTVASNDIIVKFLRCSFSPLMAKVLSCLSLGWPFLAAERWSPGPCPSAGVGFPSELSESLPGQADK